MKLYVVVKSGLEEVYVCGSIKAASDVTGLKYSRLSYHFSRMDRDKCVFDGWAVYRRVLIRSARVVG